MNHFFDKYIFLNTHIYMLLFFGCLDYYFPVLNGKTEKTKNSDYNLSENRTLNLKRLYILMSNKKHFFRNLET